MHTWVVLVLVLNGYPGAVEGDACRYDRASIHKRME